MQGIGRHLGPVFKVVLSQGAVLAALWLLRDLIPPVGSITQIVIFLVQGAAAALIGRLLGLPLIWWPLQLLLPLMLAMAPIVPAWTFLAAFALCLLIYWNSASEQVPLYLTNRRTFEAVGQIAEDAGAESLVDLGSGTGGIVLYLARTRPHLHAQGVETAPLVFLLSRLRLLLARLPNAHIRYRSLWAEDLSRHDLVYCFLSPVPMPRLYEKAKAEMRPGTLLVSNSFLVPDVEPERVVAVDDGRRTALYVYRME
ncbi:hypothetical protein [Rhizobium halophytocola]|uniref:SAM-dependent methyltransferase n=1 Tax=Rhizobium halophytocola TaxID=735519 RepID=A0ABS4DXA4_9HYPH|nr:hypothetical protein [Rhizobium halophytocola]MBP1850302.1 SAM-dependent methyltransferase [Rhizobium halophytocola]